MLKNKEIRKQASRKALASGVLIKLCLGVCVCVASVMIPFLAASLLVQLASPDGEELTQAMSEAVLAVEALLTVTLTLPTFGGFFGVAYKLYRGAPVHLAEIFAPFTSLRVYFKIIFAGIPMLVRWVAIAAVPMIVSSAVSELSISGIAPIDVLIGWGIVVFSLVCAGLLAFLTSQMFFVPYFMCNGCGVSEAFARSRSAMAGRKLGLLRYIFGFAGIFALSLLTVGALFVIYTIPMMMFAYFIYAEQSTLNITDNTERRI